MAQHMVTCRYCGLRFDANKEEYLEVSPRHYVHKTCYDRKQEVLAQDQKDKIDLEEYIIKKFKLTFVEPRIQKQIKEYVDTYHYSYSGILKSLIYFYDIKGNSLEKSNGGIGIVPYVYQKAHDYYYSIWLAQQANAEKDIASFVPQEREIVISIPEREPMKRRPLFTFLDEEED